MKDVILTVQIYFEHDVVQARQRARQLASLMGFESQDQARIATAVSEIARNCFQYGGGGKVEFRVGPDIKGREGRSLWIDISDKGKGISDLGDILAGQYISPTGMGVGLLGSKKLMDQFYVESTARGTQVRFAKDFPARKAAMRLEDLSKLSLAIVQKIPENPLQEVRTQNQELLQTLEVLRDREAQLHDVNVALEQTNIALISANKELEETNRGVMALYSELDQKAEELRRANEIKSRFLSDMSHEFRTPLNSIIGLAQLLLDRVDGELGQEQEKQITYIKRSAKELSELVNDLLDSAKVEAGKLQVNVSEFKAGDLMGTLKGMFRPLHTNPLVNLVFEQPSEDLCLASDEGKIAQILRNFISNALKFTEQGEVRISLEEIAPDHVRLSVRDQGIGIALEDQARVFEDYAQIDSPLQKKVQGTGLGLPLTKKLAHFLGGDVHLESKVGEGSTFSVMLPKRYAGPFDPFEHDAVVHLSAVTGHRRALLIDDEEIARYILSGLLSGSKYDPIEATTGEEGIRMAQQLLPDVIFLDFSMPDMNALEVIEKLHAIHATEKIPIIINTSRILSAEERARLSSRSVEILSKASDSREAAQHQVELALVKAQNWRPKNEPKATP